MNHADPNAPEARSPNDYGADFFIAAYTKILGPADRIFGAFCLLTLGLTVYGYWLGELPLGNLGVVFVFLCVNLAISRIGMRSTGRRRIVIELVRIFGFNAVLCPLVVWGTSGSPVFWWPCYLIPALGSAVVLGGLRQPGTITAQLGVAFWGVNLGLAMALALPDPDPYILAVSVAVIVVPGLIVLSFVETFVQAASRERHRFEQTLVELRAAQALLIQSEKLAALGQMAGSIAHEINSPLAALKLATQQFRRVYDPSELDHHRMSGRVVFIETLVDRIVKIVAGVRALCKDGEAEPFLTVRLKEVLDDTIVFCQARFVAAGITLSFNEENAGVAIECQPIRLSQVLLNLLNNAYDATCSSSERWVAVGVASRGDSVILTVGDSGSGIAPENRARLFEPFFTTKQAGSGTGLGLSISRRIIEAHGGTLAVDPDAPHTVFVIELPQRRASPKLTSSSPAAAGIAAAGA